MGHPFVFEWARATGVSWATAPESWGGRSFLQLYPDASGYQVVANQVPNGGSDDGGVPTGLSIIHVAPDGAPGDVWDSPLNSGFTFFATAAVRGEDLLVAWIGANGGSASEVRLTFAGAGAAPTTTALAPVGYQPDTIVAVDDGFVPNLSGRLVRLDGAGAPVGWPAPP